MLSNRLLGAFGNFLFLPIYFRLLSVSDISVMMIYIVATGAISILDFGITNIITTKLSKYSDENVNAYLVILNGKKTITKILCIFIVFAMVCVYFFAEKANVTLYFLIAIAVAVQTVFYYAANTLYAINMIESSNIIQILITAFKYIIPIIIFQAVHPSMAIYLVTQIIISYIGFWYIMRDLENKQINLEYKSNIISKNINLNEVYMLTLLGILSYLITNIDKYVLKDMVDSKEFVAYSISFMISTIPIVITSAFCAMHYPSWVKIFHNRNDFNLTKFPKKIALWALLFYAILLTFSYDIVFIWTKSPLISHIAENVLPILCLTQAIQVITMPYFFYSLANNFISTNIKILLLSLAIFIILLYFFNNQINVNLMAYIYSISILAPMPFYIKIIIYKLKLKRT